jgi:hypothetical protein
VPGTPNANPPNIAALPIGDLKTFLTVFFAFLASFFIK